MKKLRTQPKHADVQHLPCDTEWLHPYRLGRISHAETSAPTTFFRYVDVVPPWFYTVNFSWQKLSRLLAITDRELAKCAQACKAEVVPHSWGLVNEKSGPVIVARVDRIIRYCDTGIDGGNLEEYFGYDDLQKAKDPERNLPEDVRNNLNDGLRRYNRFHQSFRPMQLDDLDAARQFIYGYNMNDPEQTAPKLFLVDIEPVFGPKRDGL